MDKFHSVILMKFGNNKEAMKAKNDTLHLE